MIENPIIFLSIMEKIILKFETFFKNIQKRYNDIDPEKRLNSKSFWAIGKMRFFPIFSNTFEKIESSLGASDHVYLTYTPR